MTRLKLPVFFFIFLSSPIFSRLEIVVGRSENEGKNSLTDHNIAGGSEISESLENISLSCMDPPGIPRPDTLQLKAIPDVFSSGDPTTQAVLHLDENLFNCSNGEIKYYALLVAEGQYEEPPTNGTWDGKDWPPLPHWVSPNTTNLTGYYQATPVWWNPFSSNLSSVTYTLGVGGCDSFRYCNGPLKPNTKYFMKIRAFTDSTFQDTDLIRFRTLTNVPVSTVVFTLGGIFLLSSVAVALTLLNRDFLNRLGAFSGMKPKISSSVMPVALTHKNFLKYSTDLLTVEGRLRNEFHLLGTLSADASTPCLHGQRNDNKQKNRYVNILPFDETRVQLSILNDDPTTDYINASFIRGLSRQIEYIAAQGPKKETCHDFWRMILEQNVELIVMLTGLEERGKEKCFKYFPDHGEKIKYQDIEIKCFQVKRLSLENDDICVSRSLLVNNQLVTHFHFEKWPDFGCPESMDIVPKLCSLIHDHDKRARGSVVVHCSAGVGRSGTLIALDILLRQVRNGSKINIFDTVLQLRHQRMNMVQTEAQYGFVYKCITHVISGCPQLARSATRLLDKLIATVRTVFSKEL